MEHFPVGMEQFGAANEEQWSIIKKTIDSSDYYVLILGHRYGSVINSGKDVGMSFTEKEFQYAKTQRVPILAFIADDKAVKIDPTQLEDDDKRNRLDKFKESVMGSKLIDYWKNSDDLAAKVTAALYKQFDRTERPGWVRGGDSERSLQTIIDLNERVRQLEDENRVLRSRANRSPDLEIKISCRETLEEAEDKFKGWNNSDNREKPLYEETDDGLVIHMKHIPRGVFNTDRIEANDVPEHLRSYVSEGDIEEYNENLPDEENVKRYSYLLHKYRSLKENGVVIGLSIVNNGTVKATDINVDVDVPKSMIVSGKEDAIDLAAPQKPKMPKDPIEEAEKKYERQHPGKFPDVFELSPLEKAMQGMTGFMHTDQIATLSAMNPLSSRLASASAIGFNRTWSVSADRHNAHIWVEDLLHTYKFDKGEFVIAPTKAGEYTLHLTAICEEMAEPMEMDYKISVVDEGY